jgi:hypothetical protein
MRKIVLFGVVCVLAAAAVPGCEDPRLITVKQQFDLFFPEGSLQVDSFEQKAAAQIDILWVVDNSASMQDEQNNLADNFDSFISIIEQSQVDYQIGVISTDMELAGHQGELQGSPKIIVRGPNAESQFANNVRVGIAGAGNEQGLLAAYTALTDPLISGANAGFLRTGGALAVIFVSDEDDHSFGKIEFYQRIFEQMKDIGNENRVIAAAIVGDQPNGCTNPQTGNAQPGTRYHQLVQVVGGSIGSICSSDFSETLNQLGLTVAGLSRKFTLSDEEPEESTISVKVNGQEIQKDYQNGWSFENGSIFFQGSYVPPPAATIEVSYLHPQKEFTLSQLPDTGRNIYVTVYPPSAADCGKSSDCPSMQECGLAAKCGIAPCTQDSDCSEVGKCGQRGKCGAIDNDLAEGWVLEPPDLQNIIAFEGNYFPEGGSAVQVEYHCRGACE